MDKYKTVLVASGTTFLVMLAYEAAKELLFQGTLTPWQSHWITITITTVLATIVTLIAINRSLSYRERDLALQVREEKLKSIREVMTVVHHHVNNLSNNLQIVEVEMEDHGVIAGDTLEDLRGSIDATTKAMARLGNIEDPYEESLFKITYG